MIGHKIEHKSYFTALLRRNFLEYVAQRKLYCMSEYFMVVFFMDILEQGSAEVIFTRRSEAVQALKRYNNVRLDGKEMKIEMIGANLGLAAAPSPRVNVVPGARGRGQREVVMYGSSLQVHLLVGGSMLIKFTNHIIVA